jgi:hypothetical protein
MTQPYGGHEQQHCLSCCLTISAVIAGLSSVAGECHITIPGCQLDTLQQLLTRLHENDLILSGNNSPEMFLLCST